MTDLVTRLRDPASVKSWLDADRQRAEAADEIESLRELLRICRAERDELAAKHYAQSSSSS